MPAALGMLVACRMRAANVRTGCALRVRHRCMMSMATQGARPSTADVQPSSPGVEGTGNVCSVGSGSHPGLATAEDAALLLGMGNEATEERAEGQQGNLSFCASPRRTQCVHASPVPVCILCSVNFQHVSLMSHAGMQHAPVTPFAAF